MAKKLVVQISEGARIDKCTIGFTIANGALARGMEVGVFLVSDAVETSREGATDHTHFAPFKPLQELVSSFVDGGGHLWACTPCFKHRGLKEDETVKNTVVTGTGPMLDWIEEGAQVISI